MNNDVRALSRALAAWTYGDGFNEPCEPFAVQASSMLDHLNGIGFYLVPRMPTPEMVAVVIQQVGDPSGEAWALAERVSMGTIGPNVQAETACAELIRDWQNMIAVGVQSMPSEEPAR